MIIDTHLHVIDQSALSYPWLAGVPALNRDFPMRNMRARRRRVGIEATLHMEVDVAEDDIERETDYVGKLSRQPGSLIVGAIAACRPEDDGFAAFLERPEVEPGRQGLSPRAARHAGRAFGRRAVPRKPQAAGRHGPDLRSRRPAAPDPAGDRARRPGARRAVRARPLRRARHQGRRRASLARAHAARSPGARTSSARFPASSPMPIPTAGPSRRCGPMSSTRSARSAGTASSGAATGRSARWAAGCRPGSPPPTR